MPPIGRRLPVDQRDARAVGRPREGRYALDRGEGTHDRPLQVHDREVRGRIAQAHEQVLSLRDEHRGREAQAVGGGGGRLERGGRGTLGALGHARPCRLEHGDRGPLGVVRGGASGVGHQGPAVRHPVPVAGLTGARRDGRASLPRHDLEREAFPRHLEEAHAAAVGGPEQVEWGSGVGGVDLPRLAPVDRGSVHGGENLALRRLAVGHKGQLPAVRRPRHLTVGAVLACVRGYGGRGRPAGPDEVDVAVGAGISDLSLWGGLLLRGQRGRRPQNEEQDKPRHRQQGYWWVTPAVKSRLSSVVERGPVSRAFIGLSPPADKRNRRV